VSLHAPLRRAERAVDLEATGATFSLSVASAAATS